MNRLRGMVTAFLVLKLGVLTVNMARFPVLRRRPDVDSRAVSTLARSRPPVSLLVPMRNEAARLAASIPAMLAQNTDEIILLDDESTDGTAVLARSLLSGHPPSPGRGRRPGATRMGRQELGLPPAGRQGFRITARLL